MMTMMTILGFSQKMPARVDGKINTFAFIGSSVESETEEISFAPGASVGLEFINRQHSRVIPWIISVEYTYQGYDYGFNQEENNLDLLLLGAGLDFHKSHIRAKVLVGGSFNKELYGALDIRKFVSMDIAEMTYGFRLGRVVDRWFLGVGAGVSFYFYKLEHRQY